MNNNQALAQASIQMALDKANSIIHIGDVYGWPRPQGYTDAQAMLTAARKARLEIPPVTSAPDKPKDIQKWIDTTAEIRLRETIRRDVTNELVTTWEQHVAEAGLSAIPDFTPRLVSAFDELLEKFDALADAPRELTGHETAEQVEAHTAALRTAGDLSNAVLQRAVIANAAQEGEFIGPDLIWLILAPHADTTRDGVQNALESFKGRSPQTLTEWDELRPLGLQLAQLGEVPTRRQRHSDFMWEIGMKTPDLGQKDHSYGEIEGNPNGPAYGRQRQAETDRMFDESQSMSL